MILGVIPARYGSSRFPGKPLVEIRGKSMIQRVYEQCQKASLISRIVVATDDDRIYNHVQSFGGWVEMTDTKHVSGTERMAEIAQKYAEFGYFINIQGDEPFIDPAQINQVGEMLLDKTAPDIVTLALPLVDREKIANPNLVKVVMDRAGNALYFSRSVIPFPRNETIENLYHKHIGIYGFRREVLLAVPQMQASPLEVAESLEQLRWLAAGYRIRVGITFTESQSVDTPEDLSEFSDL
ncbi:MAG: 3-deoxy-manno-octulosonate cytidylyltransferase [Bacteroidia bacterium]|nr:3-deoxy-manno-octulosonate cytidylyltransferase [Bacteroidia bacterium]